MPIEMVLEDLSYCFDKYGKFYDVNFEIVDELSVYVHIMGNESMDIDNFYKRITRATNRFATEVVPLDAVNIITMDGSLYILVRVVDPNA